MEAFQQALDLQMEKFQGGMCLRMVALGIANMEKEVGTVTAGAIKKEVEKEMEALKLGLMDAFVVYSAAAPASAMHRFASLRILSTRPNSIYRFFLGDVFSYQRGEIFVLRYNRKGRKQGSLPRSGSSSV